MSRITGRPTRYWLQTRAPGRGLAVRSGYEPRQALENFGALGWRDAGREERPAPNAERLGGGYLGDTAVDCGMQSEPKTEEQPATTPVNVWLVEDNQDFRRTVSRVINLIPDMNCSHGFSTCEEALAALRGGEAAPNVVLLDVGLPGMSGIDGIGLIKAAAPSTHAIILTVFEDQDKIFRAICAGASGYLLKTAPVEEITEAIREVLRGGAPINGRIARRVLDMFSRFAPPRKDYGLTVRETQILELMVKGHIKKEIADQLSLSFHTVDTHLRNIYSKLQVHTRTAAVAKALQGGVV